MTGTQDGIAEMRVKSFVDEVEREGKLTRTLLERLPEEDLAWRPHPRSMSLGQLALHIASVPAGIVDLLTPAEAPVPDVPLPEPRDVREVLETFERARAYVLQALVRWGDEGLAGRWRMVADGATIMEERRADAFRTLAMNHLYHHRGQLTVYLRLLGRPLPAIYGPTADEA